MSNFQFTNEIRELQSELITEINMTERTNKNTIEALRTFLNRLKELDKLSQKKISLIFVGEKGVGKTTIICRLLNLVYKRKKSKPNGSEFEILEDILQTGSGSTTISQVRIRGVNGQSFIEISPYSANDTLDYIEAFAKYAFSKVHKLPDEVSTLIELPPEIERACRNITKLKVISKGDSRTDLAVELAGKFKREDYKLFLNNVIERSNLDKRTKTVLLFDNDKNVAEIDWLKNTFKEINLVSDDYLPLPREIVIHLGKEIFDFEELPFVNEIIDTRGLDQTKNNDRRDISGFFTSESDNLIVVTDNFVGAPSLTIINLLSTFIYDDKSDIVDKVILMFNFSDNEPNQVIDSDGEVPSEIDGIHSKKDSIILGLSQNEIPFREENILFYNPLRFLNNEKRMVITEDDLEDYSTTEEAKLEKNKIIHFERKVILNKIKNIITQKKISVEQEISKIKKDFYKIKNMSEQDIFTIQVSQLESELQKKNVGDSFNLLKEKMVFFTKTI
ncbi:hypothetical protein [Paenibacillus polymyxa]|uniref:hypothetical protein n=1 Tax=Paenibacillus polymyxa TaxID=1406 RepID=UPI000CDA84B8|nr:hypothetical protein [Paenibacillus polymyxa]POR29288.1 hypothetical protein CG775_06965 [Paenibacillus polymyxa]